jgi:hypothetical protein
VFQARLDREIQSGLIGAGLATRYDFSKHFEQLATPRIAIGQLQVNPLSGIVSNNALVSARLNKAAGSSLPSKTRGSSCAVPEAQYLD